MPRPRDGSRHQFGIQLLTLGSREKKAAGPCYAACRVYLLRPSPYSTLPSGRIENANSPTHPLPSTDEIPATVPRLDANRAYSTLCCDQPDSRYCKESSFSVAALVAGRAVSACLLLPLSRPPSGVLR